METLKENDNLDSIVAPVTEPQPKPKEKKPPQYQRAFGYWLTFLVIPLLWYYYWPLLRLPSKTPMHEIVKGFFAMLFEDANAFEEYVKVCEMLTFDVDLLAFKIMLWMGLLTFNAFAVLLLADKRLTTERGNFWRLFLPLLFAANVSLLAFAVGIHQNLANIYKFGTDYTAHMASGLGAAAGIRFSALEQFSAIQDGIMYFVTIALAVCATVYALIHASILNMAEEDDESCCECCLCLRCLKTWRLVIDKPVPDYAMMMNQYQQIPIPAAVTSGDPASSNAGTSNDTANVTTTAHANATSDTVSIEQQIQYYHQMYYYTQSQYQQQFYAYHGNPEAQVMLYQQMQQQLMQIQAQMQALMSQQQVQQ